MLVLNYQTSNLGEFVKGVFNDIIEFFKGLLNIDVGAIVLSGIGDSLKSSFNLL